MNSNVWSLKKLLKWNTKIHFTLDIPLYKVLSSHLIVMSAEKWKGGKRTEAPFLQLWEKKNRAATGAGGLTHMKSICFLKVIPTETFGEQQYS